MFVQHFNLLTIKFSQPYNCFPRENIIQGMFAFDFQFSKILQINTILCYFARILL